MSIKGKNILTHPLKFLHANNSPAVDGKCTIFQNRIRLFVVIKILEINLLDDIERLNFEIKVVPPGLAIRNSII